MENFKIIVLRFENGIRLATNNKKKLCEIKYSCVGRIKTIQVMFLSLYITIWIKNLWSWIQNLPKVVENLWKSIASILTQSTSGSYLKIIIMFTISGCIQVTSVASERVFSTTWGITYFWKIGNWCPCCFYQLRGSASILQDERLLNLSISASTLALLVGWL